MSKLIKFVCGALSIVPLTNIQAEEEQPSAFQLSAAQMQQPVVIQETALPVLQETAVEAKDIPAAAPAVETALNPFTGKIRGNRVRMRINADLESRIIKELSKTDLVTVVGEKAEFYAVEAPSELKAYIFRSFVLDNVVEGNRVNIRLLPDTEAPVLGHLNSGDRVTGKICAENSKWLEIMIPPCVHFYVAKDFIENIGGPEMKVQMDRRRETVMQMLDNADFLAKAELRKSFTDVDVERIQTTYKKIITDYADFPEYVEKAREGLAAMQEAYVQKRIAFLEAKVNPDEADEANLVREELVALDSIEARNEGVPTDKMLLWEPVEEAIYLNWASLHEDRSMQEYYNEQKEMATQLSGILEAYAAPVKNKPGDFVIRDKDMPVAYVYSTKINLQDMVGKRVSLVGVERPNNNFAFPAYFVLAQE